MIAMMKVKMVTNEGSFINISNATYYTCSSLRPRRTKYCTAVPMINK